MGKREKFTTLFKNVSITIKKIESPRSFKSKVFKQNCDEFILLLKGSATIEVDGKKIFLRKNHSFYIPKRVKHKILTTSKSTVTEWLAVYLK